MAGDPGTSRPAAPGKGLFVFLKSLLGPPIPAISAREAHGRMDSAQILDVRTVPEFKAFHIPGALHVPLSELSRRLAEIDRGREVIAVCRTGHRSQAAARLLTREGYRAANLKGGMSAWIQAELPIRGGRRNH